MSNETEGKVWNGARVSGKTTLRRKSHAGTKKQGARNTLTENPTTNVVSDSQRRTSGVHRERLRSTQ